MKTLRRIGLLVPSWTSFRTPTAKGQRSESQSHCCHCAYFIKLIHPAMYIDPFLVCELLHESDSPAINTNIKDKSSLSYMQSNTFLWIEHSIVGRSSDWISSNKRERENHKERMVLWMNAVQTLSSVYFYRYFSSVFFVSGIGKKICWPSCCPWERKSSDPVSVVVRTHSAETESRLESLLCLWSGKWKWIEWN